MRNYKGIQALYSKNNIFATQNSMDNLMKNLVLYSLLFLCASVYSQKIDSIVIPKGVTYKYCDSATFAKAVQHVQTELSDSAKSNMVGMMLFVGPNLWSRYSKLKPLSEIENGNMMIMADNKKLTGKMTQSRDDSQKFWDQIKKEANANGYKLRKATPEELRYYWSVISFDIEEPLIIIETKKHNFILNINKNNNQLLWLDEF